MREATVIRGEQARFARAAGFPTVLWKDRAEMPCGCAALVGIRLDRQEPAVVFAPCEDEEHFEVMARFRERFAESLEDAGPREAVRVACELLSATFADEEIR